MVQIIKRGVSKSDRQWRGTCPCCGSLLQAREDEVRRSMYVCGDVAYFSDCPVCDPTGCERAVTFHPITIEPQVLLE